MDFSSKNKNGNSIQNENKENTKNRNNIALLYVRAMHTHTIQAPYTCSSSLV